MLRNKKPYLVLLLIMCLCTPTYGADYLDDSYLRRNNLDSILVNPWLYNNNFDLSTGTIVTSLSVFADSSELYDNLTLKSTSSKLSFRLSASVSAVNWNYSTASAEASITVLNSVGASTYDKETKLYSSIVRKDNGSGVEKYYRIYNRAEEFICSDGKTYIIPLTSDNRARGSASASAFTDSGNLNHSCSASANIGELSVSDTDGDTSRVYKLGYSDGSTNIINENPVKSEVVGEALIDYKFNESSAHWGAKRTMAMANDSLIILANMYKNGVKATIDEVQLESVNNHTTSTVNNLQPKISEAISSSTSYLTNAISNSTNSLFNEINSSNVTELSLAKGTSIPFIGSVIEPQYKGIKDCDLYKTNNNKLVLIKWYKSPTSVGDLIIY